MKNYFLFFLLIQLYLCIYEIPNIPYIPDIPDVLDINYDLYVKNENGGNKIELRPGVFSKVIFQLSPSNFLNNDLFIISNETYKLLINDSNMVVLDNEIILKPSENLVYSTYIGLNCENSYEASYPFQFKVTYLNDSTEGIPIKYNNVTIYINTEKVSINIDILMNNMPGKSYNFFKMPSQLYNVEEINLEVTKVDNFEFKEIVIKPFWQREEISESNTDNNGILFDFPFGTKKTAEELGQTDYQFNLLFKDNNLEKCFKLSKSEFNLKINNEIPVTFDEKVKTTFKYNLKDLSSQYNIMNSIKLNTLVEISPFMLTCELSPNSLISDNLTDSNNNKKIYKNVITQSGDFDIIIHNLDSFEEYFADCELSNMDFIENDRNKMNISIGNLIEADIFHKLLPSKDENTLPQCANFTFSDISSFGAFKLYGAHYCKYIMKKKEPVALQSLETIVCESILDLNDINMNSATICVASLPLYNGGQKLTNENKDEFNNKFDDFIKSIQNFKINFIGVNIIKIKNYVKTYDIDINPSLITLSIPKESTSFPIKQLTFDVLSTHSQPLQCYYNLNLDENSKIQFQMSVKLFPNQYSQIQVGIIPLLSENKMYSLNFKCYNLPGFKYRYKTTGSMTMYTYWNSDNGINQLIENLFPSTLTLNCNEKQNQLNPRCIIETIAPILENIQTDIPTFIKEYQNKILSYAGMVINAQFQYLNPLINEFIQNFTKPILDNIISSLFENATNIFNYLSNTDCSIYVSGSNINDAETINNKDYVDCRKGKQNNLEEVIKILKPYLECSYLIENITSGLGGNLEENLKYTLFLINEITKNPDSFKQGISQIIYDATFCLQNKFDEYWKSIDIYLKDTKQYLNTSIVTVKKDALYIILQSLTNLVKIIHFEEIDGYLNGIKTKTGLLVSDNAVKIQNGIIELCKKLNEFGDGTYSLSTSVFLTVITNKGSSVSDGEVQILNIPSKDILIKIYPNYMLRKNNAKYLQILVFDSPLISVKTNGDEEETSDSVNTFINIVLYSDKNEEILIKDIDEKYKPEILYLKDKYESLKKCFYYNEEKKELENDGVVNDENYVYNEKSYFKCTSSHLTAFTAGTYNFNSNLPWWGVLLIVCSILLVLVCFVIIFIIVKKKKAKSRLSKTQIDSTFKKKEELLDY